MFAPLVLFTWLTFVSTSTGAPSTSKTVELGKVIDLRGTNLLEDFQERERTVFEPFDSKCFIDEIKEKRFGVPAMGTPVFATSLRHKTMVP